MRFDEDKHVAYEGQEFRIEWYVNAKGESQALNYANEMPESHIGKLMHLLEVMVDRG